MKIVFVDFASLHPADLCTEAIYATDDSIDLWDDSTPEQLAERIAEADVIVVNKIQLDESALVAAPRLRLICLAATGADNIDLNAARRRGIAVCNIRDYCTPAVVQHVFALILSLTQRLDAYRKQIHSGAWQRSRTFCLLDPPIRELAGQTLGIIGYGTLGRAVAGAATTFGLKVCAASRPGQPTTDNSVVRLPLQVLLQEADIISLHCPLTPATHHLINAASLREMQAHALLINTARGGLVDSAALADALQTGVIGGAGIDVLPEEPPVNGDPLLHSDPPNLIITPHIAWSTREARQRALDAILENISGFKSGDLRNCLV